MQRLVGLALTVVERTAAFPRRFSRLPLEGRAAALERMEASRAAPRRDALALLKGLVSVAWARDPRVTGALGIRAGCERAGDGPIAREAPPLDPAALALPGGPEECDVVVVGSGAGGAAAARVLAEAGLDVVVLEEGPYHDASTYSRDPLEALPRLYRDAGLTLAEGRPAIPLPVGRCVGGTTVINSGTCLRPAPGVLAEWRDRAGIPWAGELEQELDALERDLAVVPVDPATAGRNADLVRAGAEALRASNRPLPRNAGDVACCQTCPTGCALDAKRAVHVSELPRAVAAGARVRAGVRVEEVVVAEGRATGVAGRAGERPYAVRARAVVLAAGALGTPALLRRQGLGGPAVGRHLRIHPACWVGARFDEEVRGWEGVMQSWLVDEWLDRGLFLEATFTPLAFGAHWLRGAGEPFAGRLADFGRVATLGVHLSERSSAGRVGADGRVRYRLTADDAARLRFGIARAADVLFAAGAREVHPQVAGVPVLRPGDQGERVERARLRPSHLRLEAFHPLGSVRMGADPAAAPLDARGRVNGVPGLYVADASALPSSPGVNPMLTIMAVARRVGRELAQTLAR